MVSTVNESGGIGGGYGFGGGFGGGDGIVGLIALMSIFRGHFGQGDYDKAGGCLCEVQNQLANIRADIGEDKYTHINATLNQTIGLMQQINEGRFEQLNSLFNQTMHLDSELKCIQKDICDVDKDVLINRFESAKGFAQVDKDVVVQGLQNQIGNLMQTNEFNTKFAQAQHQADLCCCRTNENIMKSGYETQLRDLCYKNDTDKQLADLKCGQGAIMAKIDESRLLEENCRLKDKLEALRECNDRNYLAGIVKASAEKNKDVTLGLWGAEKAFNGVDFIAPPTCACIY